QYGERKRPDREASYVVGRVLIGSLTLPVLTSPTHEGVLAPSRSAAPFSLPLRKCLSYAGRRQTMMIRRAFLRTKLLLIVSLALLTNAGAEHLPVTIYTSADGLGSGFIDFLMRDARGFMWFCTRDGLSRFDGARFVTYRIGDKNGPPGIEGLY